MPREKVMADDLIKLSDDFWNVRGKHKVLGVLDVGTQMSLVRLTTGDFALLDCYRLRGTVREEILSRTEGGKRVTAIVNLHPFHTVHVRSVAQMFPRARLFGTRRHEQLMPELKWQPMRSEDPRLNELFPTDLSFSVPRGVELIPANENLHFASVLAFHHTSKTLHVDDTLVWSALPLVKGLRFHPTLKRVLERRAGAVGEFRSWAKDLVERCHGVRHLCTAHMKPLPPQASEGKPVSALVAGAVARAQSVLEKHEARYE